MTGGLESSDRIAPPNGESAMQRLLTESSADELIRQLSEPLHPEKSDLAEMVSRSITVLSTMAAELGVILRVQVRTNKTSASVDEEKFRRVLNALVIHLLSVSQSAGWVTIGLEEQQKHGRRGYSFRLMAENIILPWKTIPEYEEALTTQAELSLCRKIVEKQGGKFSFRVQDDNKLAYSIWLPA